MDTETPEHISEKLLDLCDSVQDRVGIPMMAYILANFAAQMAYDCAPTKDSASELLELAISDATYP